MRPAVALAIKYSPDEMRGSSTDRCRHVPRPGRGLGVIHRRDDTGCTIEDLLGDP
jgi:hypothetical protein